MEETGTLQTGVFNIFGMMDRGGNTLTDKCDSAQFLRRPCTSSSPLWADPREPPAHPGDRPTCTPVTQSCFWESLRNNKDTKEKSRERQKERTRRECMRGKKQKEMSSSNRPVWPSGMGLWIYLKRWNLLQDGHI